MLTNAGRTGYKLVELNNNLVFTLHCNFSMFSLTASIFPLSAGLMISWWFFTSYLSLFWSSINSVSHSIEAKVLPCNSSCWKVWFCLQRFLFKPAENIPFVSAVCWFSFEQQLSISWASARKWNDPDATVWTDVSRVIHAFYINCQR